MIKSTSLKHISWFTFSAGMFIIISASFMLQVRRFVQACIGDKETAILLWVLMFVVCGIFLVYAISKRVPVIKVSIIILSIMLVLFWARSFKIPVEKIHILEYGFLGWLATRDLVIGAKKVKGVIFAFIFCAIIGALDEGFQAILPYRYCEFRDFTLNCFGGILGIISYFLAR